MDEKIFESGTLDMAYNEETFEAAAARLAKRFGVHVRVMQKNGPGGGWPLVTIVGELEDVAKCIRECWVSGDKNDDDSILAHALAEGGYVE